MKDSEEALEYYCPFKRSLKLLVFNLMGIWVQIRIYNWPYRQKGENCLLDAPDLSYQWYKIDLKEAWYPTLQTGVGS